MNPNCIFCKIVRNEIPSPRVYEDSDFICIRDIRPQAPVHLLLIPKEHVASLDEAVPENGIAKSELLGDLLTVGTVVARKQGLLPQGFRSVINTGAAGGQTVFHIHLHLLGGEALGEDLA
jgi:histidine triad (HIT) family protein